VGRVALDRAAEIAAQRPGCGFRRVGRTHRVAPQPDGIGGLERQQHAGARRHEVGEGAEGRPLPVHGVEALAETLELFAAHWEVVRAHIARAHAECAGGTPAATVIEALQASLAAARADLAAGLAELPSLAQRIAPLQDTMRNTLAEVHAAFKAALEAAAAALKAAFGGR
jgi:hypothetical protein